MSDCDECRRGLLRAGIGGVAVLLVPGCGAPNGSGPGDSGGPDEAGDDAPGDDGGEGGGEAGGEGGACQVTCTSGTKTLEFTFAKYPALKNVGGSVVNNAPGYSDPSCGRDVIIVAQPTSGKYVAFSAGCPHQCCIVGYDSKHTQFLCPCHSSTFNVTSGQVTGGPAPNGLQKLTVCVDECAVYVSYP
jgi:Rieske Fe-S protein